MRAVRKMKVSWPFGVALRREASSRLMLRWLKTVVVSDEEKAPVGYRTRLWKTELAALAAETGLEITVSHFPPGTSKWNKIEHRLFSHISMNWRGRPLTSHEVIVSLIANTRTRAGLTVAGELDPASTPRHQGQRPGDARSRAEPAPPPPRLAPRMELQPHRPETAMTAASSYQRVITLQALGGPPGT